jgi:hypothetical protein
MTLTTIDSITRTSRALRGFKRETRAMKGSATRAAWIAQAASNRHREIRDSVSPMASRAIAVS